MSTDNTALGHGLTCFVIGPIGSRHSPHGSDERIAYEEALEVFEEVIRPACASVGLEPVRADGLRRVGELPEQIFRRLRDDDVVIADLTGANPNVMYELGLRHTRDALTLQIGEFSRLPFDVNVINTVMFSRSPMGLISARNELTALLGAGLAGEYDLVSATRLWTDSTELSATNQGRVAVEDISTNDELEEELGLLDLVARGEEEQNAFVEATNRIGNLINEMGSIAEKSSVKMEQSDAAGRGMKGRLAIATEFANGLDELAGRLEADVDAYEAGLAAVSGANLALIGALEEDPSQVDGALDYGYTIRRLAETARGTLASLSEMVAIMEANAKLSRVLRAPTSRVVSALNRYARATSVMDEWDRRLQALGVPVPPDDWEPPEESGDDEA